MKLKVYNQKGKEVEEMVVSDKVFGLKRNDDLIHQVFVAIAANQRQNLAHTKTRGERAGSGIKPWKQKGTGRARVGSVRTPLWKKGGVVFGPRNDRNYKQKINKKMTAQAIMMVLSGKLKDQEIKVVDKLELKEKKTQEVVRLMNNLKIQGKALFSFVLKEKDLKMYTRNIAGVTNILTEQLNVVAMLKSKYMVMSKASIKFLNQKYTQNK